MGLIGPSGAGKSTLIRCINRLVEPTSGQVFLGDIEITALSRGRLREARRRIGMIFQEFALVERLTVMENVLSGRLGYVPFWRSFLRRFPRGRRRQGVRSCSIASGSTEHVDKRADALSGGQRQRVGIARALEQDPELLLVDEPTASLDPKTSRQIMRLICEICAERQLAAIINIHDVALAQMFVRPHHRPARRQGRLRRAAGRLEPGHAGRHLRRGGLDRAVAKHKEDAEDAARICTPRDVLRATSSRPAHEPVSSRRRALAARRRSSPTPGCAGPSMLGASLYLALALGSIERELGAAGEGLDRGGEFIAGFPASRTLRRARTTSSSACRKASP